MYSFILRNINFQSRGHLASFVFNIQCSLKHKATVTKLKDLKGDTNLPNECEVSLDKVY